MQIMLCNLLCCLDQTVVFFYFVCRGLQVKMVVQAQQGPLETEALQEPWACLVPKVST